MILPSRIHDLSQPVFTNCPQYPDKNPRPAQVRLFYLLAVQGVNKEIVELSTHTGTHCDAPYHFFEDGAMIDQVPLETYIGRATILDLRGRRPGSAIEREEVERYSERIASGDIVLLNTGWGHKRANSKEFLTEYVYLSGEAAQYFVERDVKGVGIDAVSLGRATIQAKLGRRTRRSLGAVSSSWKNCISPTRSWRKWSVSLWPRR